MLKLQKTRLLKMGNIFHKEEKDYSRVWEIGSWASRSFRCLVVRTMTTPLLQRSNH